MVLCTIIRRLVAAANIKNRPKVVGPLFDHSQLPFFTRVRSSVAYTSVLIFTKKQCSAQTSYAVHTLIHI